MEVCMRNIKSTRQALTKERNVVGITVLCIIIQLVLYIPTVMAQTKAESFPIPLKIDGSGPVSTSMYIRCDYIQHGKSFHAFKNSKRDPAGITLTQLMQALSTRNSSICADLAPGKRSLTPSEAKKHREQVVKIVDRLQGFFDGSMDAIDINKLLITKQFLVGNDIIFIWGVDSGYGKDRKSPLRRWFRFEKDSETEIRWNGGKIDPLAVLLTHMMQYSAEAPGKFLPKKAGTFDYNFPIPGTTKGHAVLLQFNGKTYDFDVFDSGAAKQNDEVAAFYQRAYQAFMSAPQDLADFYTPVSQKKLIEWLAQMTPEDLAKYQQAILNAGRTVRFILDADPVFIVFYTVGKSKEFRYTYVVREPSKGQLKLTNFYFNNYFDQLINEKLFRDSFSSSILPDESGQAVGNTRQY
jgi:hypothetical protein